MNRLGASSRSVGLPGIVSKSHSCEALYPRRAVYNLYKEPLSVKINCMAIAACLGLALPGDASAVPVEQTLKFKASVPEEDFTVTPNTPWPTGVINLNYNNATQEFGVYRMSMTIDSKTHDINAKLEEDPNLSLSTDKNILMLMNVQIDGVLINKRGRTVHFKGPFGRDHDLTIKPHYPAASHPSGKYTGKIVLIFDVE